MILSYHRHYFLYFFFFDRRLQFICLILILEIFSGFRVNGFSDEFLVKFEGEKLPAILNAIETENNGQKLVLEVAVCLIPCLFLFGRAWDK